MAMAMAMAMGLSFLWRALVSRGEWDFAKSLAADGRGVSEYRSSACLVWNWYSYRLAFLKWNIFPTAAEMDAGCGLSLL